MIAPATELITVNIRKMIPSIIPAVAIPLFALMRPFTPNTIARIVTGYPAIGINHAIIYTIPRTNAAVAKPFLLSITLPPSSPPGSCICQDRAVFCIPMVISIIYVLRPKIYRITKYFLTIRSPGNVLEKY